MAIHHGLLTRRLALPVGDHRVMFLMQVLPRIASLNRIHMHCRRMEGISLRLSLNVSVRNAYS